VSTTPVRGGWPLPRAPLATAVFTLVLLATVALTPLVDSAVAACPGAHVKPRGDASIAKMRRATLCLINARRSNDRRGRVGGALKLRRAGRRHARSMARHDYFSHVGRNGSTPADRVRRTGYPRGGWAVGEVIAWGRGRSGTPARIVKRWMRSSSHRDVILGGNYRDLGVGVYGGCPCKRDRRAATYVLDFGHR
jgi:uncharacterized protein YkwD